MTSKMLVQTKAVGSKENKLVRKREKLSSATQEGA